MILHLRLPDQCARDRVHGVGIGAQIAKKHGKLVGTGDRGKADCGSNDRLRFERPAGASAFGVKSIDLAITAPHKYQAAHNRWLGNCGRSAKKSKRPLQPQQGHLVSRQSGHRCWLKPAVAEIRPPAIPSRPIEPLGKPDRVLRALGNVGRGSLRYRGNSLLLRVCREWQSCDASNCCNEVLPTHRSVPLLCITTA
jgi:hypothetical protein